MTPQPGDYWTVRLPHSPLLWLAEVVAVSKAEPQQAQLRIRARDEDRWWRLEVVSFVRRLDPDPNMPTTTATEPTPTPTPTPEPDDGLDLWRQMARDAKDGEG